VTSALALASADRGLSWAGKHSSRPSANSGIRHSGGTRPTTPLSCIIVAMVTRTSRLAAVNSRKASGSSTTRAETRLIVKPGEPKSSVRSNHASQTNSVPVMIMKKITTWRWCQAAQAVAANPASSAMSSPTHAACQWLDV
jgi:hypothetical protein